MAARQGALAAGAARASGERAKRRSTPLIGAEPIVPADAPDPTSDAVPAPVPVVTGKASAEEGGVDARRRAAEEVATTKAQAKKARPRRRRRQKAASTSRRRATPGATHEGGAHDAGDGGGGDHGRRPRGIRADR